MHGDPYVLVPVAQEQCEEDEVSRTMHIPYIISTNSVHPLSQTGNKKGCTHHPSETQKEEKGHLFR